MSLFDLLAKNRQPRFIKPRIEQLEDRYNPVKFFDNGTLALLAEVRAGIAEPVVPVFYNGGFVANANVVEGYQLVSGTTSYPLVFVDIVANTYERPTYTKPDGSSGSLGTSLINSASIRTNAGLMLVPTVSRADVS